MSQRHNKKSLKEIIVQRFNDAKMCHISSDKYRTRGNKTKGIVGGANKSKSKKQHSSCHFKWNRSSRLSQSSLLRRSPSQTSLCTQDSFRICPVTTRVSLQPPQASSAAPARYHRYHAAAQHTGMLHAARSRYARTPLLPLSCCPSLARRASSCLRREAVR